MKGLDNTFVYIRFLLDIRFVLKLYFKLDKAIQIFDSEITYFVETSRWCFKCAKFQNVCYQWTYFLNFDFNIFI